MQHISLVQRAGKWLVVASLLAFGFAMAQPEPSLNQVYATAQAGKLDEAQVMSQQVLISHHHSSTAHFVRAELFARQGNLKLAREALATAEELSPGLAFAKPDAVQALRAQLTAKSTPKSVNTAPVSYAAPANTASSSSWTLPLLLAGGVMVAGYFIFRRRNPLDGSDKNDYQAINDNPDRGGANFGVNDASSWDDGGSADLGGGSDWDN
jgi:hypothetical protein